MHHLKMETNMNTCKTICICKMLYKSENEKENYMKKLKILIISLQM